jgi:sugar phosphate isomerase/epimerase
MVGARIAVQTKCLAQPLKQALHTAGALACDGVQIDLRYELPEAEVSDTGLRQLRKVLDDLNLRVGSAAFPTRRGYADPAELDRRLEATVRAMRLASRLAARTLVVGLGPLPPPDSPGRATLHAALENLAAHGNRLGVDLAASCPSAEPTELADFIAELPERALGVDLNPADLIRHDRRPPQFIAALGPHIAHVFANDAVRGLGGSDAMDVELGRGSADMPELLGLLEEYDYRGWITVQRRHSPRPAEELADAVQFLRSL